MVRLIQIDRLAPRIEGMLYKVAFDETWALMDDVGFFFPIVLPQSNKKHQSAKKLFEAGKTLLDAKNFKELLSVRARLSLKAHF
jgi:cytokinesis protein